MNLESLDPRHALRVLLIEDDEDDYILARGLLDEVYGNAYSFDWASSYDSGRELLLQNAYSVCLADYRLGAETGLTLVREAVAKGCDVPIIMLTGQDDPTVDLEAMRAGAADYLVKGQLNAALLERSIRYVVEERRRAAERLQLLSARQAQAEAEAQNRAKDEFIMLVSHELRNPLSAILGWVQALRLKGDATGLAAKALESIERSALSQKKLIDDLLDMARITSGKLRLQVNSLELADVVNSAVDTIRPAIEAKQITLGESFDTRGTPIEGDGDRLQQVVWNLLSNAVKFSQPGGRIDLALRRHEAFVELEVCDNGEGIDAALLPQVFDRFRQGEQTGKRHQGLGLGLSLVRYLIEAHGGSVSAASDGVGCGARFTIRIPLREIVAPAHL